MYKIVAIDMDGTLLDDHKIISEENIKAIKEAKKKGVYVVLATGRPVEGLKHYLDELRIPQMKDYVACFNGAMVCDNNKETIISETFLEGRDYKRLYSLAKKININLHAFTLNGCTSPKMSEYTKLEGDLNNIPIIIKDVSEIDDDAPIIKMMLVDPYEKLEEGIKKIPQEFYDDYMVVRSAPFFLEFLNKKCDKWEGIKNLADYLNVPYSDIICIGDAGNDLGMVKNAGLGIAMANSFKEVLDAAKFITKSNNDSGVAYAINKFVLEKI